MARHPVVELVNLPSSRLWCAGWFPELWKSLGSSEIRSCQLLQETDEAWVANSNSRKGSSGKC